MGTRRTSFLPDGRTRLLGILGDPLDHSLSPSLHSAVLARLGRNLLYVPVPVSARRLPAFLRLAHEAGFLGLNVTTPYKERVFRLATPADRETERTRMVNTIQLAPGEALGSGTDGAGILAWLERFDLAAGRIAVLGFGPTARSFVHRGWQARASLQVWTRRPAAVRRELARWGARIPVQGWDGSFSRRGPASRTAGGRGAVTQRTPETAAAARGRGPAPHPALRDLASVDIVVSTLPPRVALPQAFWRALPGRAVLLDMNYGADRMTLRDRALDFGLRAAGGLGPLLEQASRSLSIWLGEPVETRLFERAGGYTRADLAPSPKRSC